MATGDGTDSGGPHEAGLIRGALKRTVERALASAPVTRLTRHRVRHKRLILAYHGVIPAAHRGPPAGERALFVPQEGFAAQMDVLAGAAEVVPLERIDDGGDGRPRVAITFDDAYHGAVTTAVDELRARNLPATVFVAPGRLDGHVFWWDALAGDGGELDAELRRYALNELGGDDERVRDWATAHGRAVQSILPPYARSASIDDIARAVAAPGITLGSHSWSHAALPSLAAAELADELRRSHRWLTGHFAQHTIPWLAYPYGLASPAVHAAAAEAGYAAAVAITGGWHRPDTAVPFARPRLTIGRGMSVDGFRARLLGALGT